MAIYHWLRIAGADDRNVCHVIGGEWTGETVAPKFRQPFCRVHETGARWYFGSQDGHQPGILEIPGTACEMMSSEMLSALAVEMNGWVCRCDLAVDVGPESEARTRMDAMVEVFTDEGLRAASGLRTRIPPTSCKEYIDHDADGGKGVYFGKRQSEFFLRVYDRRKLLRIEAELKPMKRMQKVALARSLAKYGPSRVFAKSMEKCFFPFDWFRDVIQEQGEPGFEEVQTRRVPSSIFDAVENIRGQYGFTMWALEKLGVDPRQVLAEPRQPLSCEQERRVLELIACARANGDEAAARRLEESIKPYRRAACRR